MSSQVLKMKPKVEATNIGITNTKMIVSVLEASLADTYALMAKTQACHWNAVGPLFHSVHEMTEEQYRDLFAAADDLAERIRALGFPAPASLERIVSSSVIGDGETYSTTEEMLSALVVDHETVARRMRSAVDTAESNLDPVTADMLTERMAFHEKTSWMLRALLTQ